MRAPLSSPELLQVADDEPPELPRGKAIHDGVQNAVGPHEEQRDLVRVVEHLPGVLPPVGASPALLDLQDRQGPGALDDMVRQETHDEHAHDRQQHLKRSPFDPPGLFRGGGVGLGGRVAADISLRRILQEQGASDEQVTHHNQEEDDEKQRNDGEVGGGHRLLLRVGLVVVALEAAGHAVLVPVGPRGRQEGDGHRQGQQPDGGAHGDAAAPVVRGGGAQRAHDGPVAVNADGPQEEDGAVGVDEEQGARDAAHEVRVDPASLATVVADPGREGAHEEEVGDGQVDHVDADFAHGLYLTEAVEDEEHVDVLHQAQDEEEAVADWEESVAKFGFQEGCGIAGGSCWGNLVCDGLHHHLCVLG